MVSHVGFTKRCMAWFSAPEKPTISVCVGKLTHNDPNDQKHDFEEEESVAAPTESRESKFTKNFPMLVRKALYVYTFLRALCFVRLAQEQGHSCEDVGRQKKVSKKKHRHGWAPLTTAAITTSKDVSKA